MISTARRERADASGPLSTTSESTPTTQVVTRELADLFSYSSSGHAADRDDPCTLTFSSMLAAMTAGTTPSVRRPQRHLGLRGTAAATVTKGRSFTPRELPERFTTTALFRTAYVSACKLRGDDDPGRPTDVRHIMAAYAVCPDYHSVDFLRLRIDRRAWCIELAALLREDPREAVLWQADETLASHIPLPPFNSDSPDGRDLLNIDREVEAFSRAHRRTQHPHAVCRSASSVPGDPGRSLSCGACGTGVAHLGKEARSGDGSYHDRIAQVEFNAWHYSEGSLIACRRAHLPQPADRDEGRERVDLGAAAAPS